MKLSRGLSAIIPNLDQQALEALLCVDHYRKAPPGRATPGMLVGGRWAPEPPPDFSNWSESRWFNFERYITELAELSSEALTFVQVVAPPKPRGRPRRGAFSIIFSRSLAEFTLYLLLDVRAAGGRLTLDKNAGTGTLVEALALLRPHLPLRFIPNKLPLSTLAHVKALDKKIATAPHSFENNQS